MDPYDSIDSDEGMTRIEGSSDEYQLFPDSESEEEEVEKRAVASPVKRVVTLSQVPVEVFDRKAIPI